jgi:hypothetical protein
MTLFQQGKAGPAPLLTVIMLAAAAVACVSPLPAPAPTAIDQPQPPTGTAQAPAVPPSDQAQAPEPAPVNPTQAVAPTPESTIQIRLIHYRGTLARIGCCNPALYESDEFVVIQNTGSTYVDITNWRLTNVTKGYPTFIFPSHFPCIPYVGSPDVVLAVDIKHADSRPELAQNPDESLASRFSTGSRQTKPANEWGTCPSCTYLKPPDLTPMKPAEGQQGLPLPSILYPGQTMLIFTDEVHCQTGGFSFNWGLGNIWNNEIADTAVLYNAAGEEVSRRSYLVGR